MLIATAGHVDHGKTSLVRALTGVETDRLDEEKRRGLTIELGFAYKPVSPDHTLGFIDVPGHHRFMNTMISGVNGIDLGLLVVAADDGPMPQTHEHLQILRLLGITEFLAVISKIDLVDDARLEAVAQQISVLLPEADLCKVSVKSNIGITDLSNILLEKAKTLSRRKASGAFRMFIDRVFTKKGSGLVVTGTALSGQMEIGDTLFLHSASGVVDKKTPAKIRAIHAQGRNAEIGYAGQRCAINISGRLSADDVQRGDFICAQDSISPALRLDCRFTPVQSGSRRLKHMGNVKLYIGSRKLSARTYFLSKKKSALSEKDANGHWVQFILDKGVIAFNGDKVLIRDDSEHHILGGGIVIDPDAKKPAKDRAARLNRLTALAFKDPHIALGHFVFNAGEIINQDTQKRIWNFTDNEIDNILSTAPFEPDNFVKRSRKTGDLILSKAMWDNSITHMTQTLSDWHKADLQNRSMSIDILKSLTGLEIPAALFSDIMSALIKSGKVTQTENQVRLFGYKPKLTLRTDLDWHRLEIMMQGRRPLRSEIEKELGFDPQKIEALTRSKLKSGDLFNIGEKRIGHPATLFTMAEQISELSKNGPFTIIDAKKAFDLGRDQTIEVLEFFDTIKFTARDGNTRTANTLDIARRVFKR